MAMIDEDIDEAGKLEGAIVQRASLRRLKGYAYLQLGDPDAAKQELDKSLELAREAKARFEEGLTSFALSTWAEAAGAEDEWKATAQEIFDELGVVHPAHLDITEAPDDESGHAPDPPNADDSPQPDSSDD
jgi:hypothetical protein